MMIRRKNIVLFSNVPLKKTTQKLSLSLNSPFSAYSTAAHSHPHSHTNSHSFHRFFSSLSSDKQTKQQQLSDPLQKPSLITRFRKELNHYVNGSRLLALEVRVSTRLIAKLLRGTTLIRREQEQLKRTISDLFRLLPFSVFIIVPFLEFALPLFLRLFPGMLPSTFADALKEEEAKVKQIKLKIQMAAFLQDTLKQMSQQEGHSSQAANELFLMFQHCKASNQTCLSTQAIVQVAKAFGSHLTLDSFNRATLTLICRFMGIACFGTDSMLRFRIRRAMSRLKADDQLIMREGGADSLTEAELRTACHERGIGCSRREPISKLRTELDQWIDLHLNQQLPLAMLILSRALSIQLSVSDGLRQTITSTVPNPEQQHIIAADTIAEQTTEERLHEVAAEEECIKQELARKPEATAASEEVKESLKVAETINALASTSPVENEREQLENLKREIANDRNFIETHETSSTTRHLASKVETLVDEIMEQVQKTEREIGSRLHLISSNAEGNLSVEEIERVLQACMQPKYKEKVTEIIQRYDRDGDGQIFLSEVREVIASQSRADV